MKTLPLVLSFLAVLPGVAPGFGASGQMGMKKLGPLAKAAVLTVAILFSYAANAAAQTKNDLAVTNGDNPLFPFSDRLPSVFSALGEKANS